MVLVRLGAAWGCGVGQPTVRPQKKRRTRLLGRYADEQIEGQGVKAREISGWHSEDVVKWRNGRVVGRWIRFSAEWCLSVEQVSY